MKILIKSKPAIQIQLLVISVVLLVFPLLCRASMPTPIQTPTPKPETQKEKCQKTCENDLPKRSAYIEIDANTGEVLGGSTKFAAGEKVQVIYSRMNPFKYKYRFQEVSMPLDTAIATSFLQLIPGFGTIIDSINGKPLPMKAPTASGTSCPGAALPQWTVLYSKAQPLTVTSSQIKKTLDMIKEVNSPSKPLPLVVVQ